MILKWKQKLGSFIIPLKKGIMFLTEEEKFDCLCVCVSVCHRLWRDGCTQQHGVKWGRYCLQELEIATLVNMIRFRIRIIWIIRIISHFSLWLQNLWTDSHQILPVCSSARGTSHMLRILRSIDKSKFYGHFKRIRVNPKKSSALYFHSICL